jgi:hypothetical protein
LKYTSANTANIQSGATIGGTTERVIPQGDEVSKGAAVGVLGSFLFRLYAFLAIFITGLVLILIAKRFLTLLALSINDHPVSSLGWGALIFFITPLAALVVMATVIGAPLGLISLILWGIFLYLSQIPVALLVGWLILSRRRDNFSYGSLVGHYALGLAILYALSAIPILGWIMWLFVMIFGLGSLISSLRNRRKVILTTPVP